MTKSHERWDGKLCIHVATYRILEKYLSQPCVPVVLDLQLCDVLVLVGGDRDEPGRGEGPHEDRVHVLAIVAFLSGIRKLDHVHAWLVPVVNGRVRVMTRGIRNPGVEQCLGFCAAEFLPSLASVEQKLKHCLTPGFQIPLVMTRVTS